MLILGQHAGFWANQAGAGSGIVVRSADVDWNFAVTGSLVDATSTYTLSHTRSPESVSRASYFDSAGDLAKASTAAPRFGYDPVTLDSLGLICEPLHYNSMNYSEQIGNVAVYTESELTITDNAGVFIDGNTVADKCIASTASSTHYFEHGGANAPGTGDYCNFSGFFKAGEITNMLFEAEAGSGGIFKMWVDLSTGTVGDTSGTNFAHGVEAMQDDWYLVWAQVVTVTSNTCKMRVYPSTGTTSGDETYAGNASDGFLACGLNLNLDVRSMAYYRGPTIGSDVTQERDVVEIATTGWFNTTEGTFVVEFHQFAWQNLISTYLLSVVDVSANTAEYMNMYINGHSGTSKTKIFSSSSASFDATGAANGPGENGSSIMAFAYKADDSQFVMDGVAQTTDTSVTLPSNLDKMYINRFNTDLTKTGVQYKRIRYWNTRLTEEELVALSTP